MRIEVFTSPGCPNADAARTLLNDCLAELGIHAPIVDRVGRYPSPTVLVDCIDVMRQEPGAPIGDACRLDPPTPQRVLEALRATSRNQVESHSNPHTGGTSAPARSATPGRSTRFRDKGTHRPNGRGVYIAVADAEHRRHARHEFVYWFDEPESE